MRDWSDLPIGELLILFLLVVVIVTFVAAFAARQGRLLTRFPLGVPDVVGVAPLPDLCLL
jgi:hypothetical protein